MQIHLVGAQVFHTLYEKWDLLVALEEKSEHTKAISVHVLSLMMPKLNIMEINPTVVQTFY